MKYRDLTPEFIMSLDEETLFDIKGFVRQVGTNVKKGLKKAEAVPVVTDADGKYLAGLRSQVAKNAALAEAVMTREDELYGPGVLSTYDHGAWLC